MKTKLITAIALTLSLTGCATTVQQPASLTEYKAMSERVYQRTPEEVMNAAEKVIRLADSDANDVKVIYADDSIQIERKYNAYFVIGSTFATYTYKFTTTKVPEGTKVNLAIEADVASGMIPIGNKTAFTTPSLYDLYFSRMDYLLGLSNEWVDCKSAEAKFPNTGSFSGLCTMAEDNKPTTK